MTRDPAPLFQFTDSLLPQNTDGAVNKDLEKADVIHDFLAYLAKQMIEMNKLKNGILKDFKTDLEGLLGEKINKISRLFTPPKPPKPSRYKDESAFKEKMREYESKMMAELLQKGITEVEPDSIELYGLETRVVSI